MKVWSPHAHSSKCFRLHKSTATKTPKLFAMITQMELPWTETVNLRLADAENSLGRASALFCSVWRLSRNIWPVAISLLDRPFCLVQQVYVFSLHLCVYYKISELWREIHRRCWPLAKLVRKFSESILVSTILKMKWKSGMKSWRL